MEMSDPRNTVIIFLSLIFGMIQRHIIYKYFWKDINKNYYKRYLVYIILTIEIILACIFLYFILYHFVDFLMHIVVLVSK